MSYAKLKYTLLIWLFLFSCITGSFAQNNENTVIKGVIIDADSKEPIPLVTVSFVGKNSGTFTDFEGKYMLVAKAASNQIKISCLGYKQETRKVTTGKSQIINIELHADVSELNEVVVRYKKKYKNKDNPAVTLIGKVIENKSKNREDQIDYLQYEKYEKIQFALSNISEKFQNRKALKKFHFIFDNIDTTELEGKKVLPVFLKETISDYYYRKEPKATKETVKATKMVSFEGYVDNQGMTDYLKFLYQDINIYDNNVMLLTNMFLSPVSATAPTLYKYYIIDTSMVDNDRCIKLFFSPRNKQDMLLQGFLYIMMDSSYAVRRVDMTVNKEINLNWARDLKIVQNFEKNADQQWMLTYDELSIDFGISKNNMGLFGQRKVSYKNFQYNVKRDDSLYSGQSLVEEDGANIRNEDYWATHRHRQLSKSEAGTYKMMDSIQHIPAFKRTMDIALVVFSGYKHTNYLDIGPISTFYSYNPIEGFRLRFGGRTTPKVSKKLNFETYLAYGFKDEKFKYYIGTAYSFTDKSVFEFPVKSLRLSHQYETKIPGQELQFIQEDNIFLSIKRGVNDKLLYNRSFKIDHLNEFESHFSYDLAYEYIRQAPAGSLYYNNTDYLLHENSSPYINISQINFTLRYAPHEQFYQGKQFRTPLVGKYPVFQLQCSWGSKDILASDYNYENLHLSISKRFFLSVLGYTDVLFEADKIFGTVSYPLLNIHRANQTYSYQLQSYNLMNFLEFVSDKYISLNIDHYFNGLIFNKIPFVKKLKLREVATCKLLYGGLSNNNDPAHNSDLFKFPVEDDGTPVTYTLDKKPYTEVSVGIANIFKFFRVDLVKRLTYLDHPVVASIGVRMRFKIDF